MKKILQPTNSDNQIRATAVSNGCVPLWHDGIFGWKYHCMCRDYLHCYDSQCSVITEESAKRNRK